MKGFHLSRLMRNQLPFYEVGVCLTSVNIYSRTSNDPERPLTSLPIGFEADALPCKIDFCIQINSHARSPHISIVRLTALPQRIENNPTSTITFMLGKIC